MWRPERRFGSAGGAIYPNESMHCEIADGDTRRVVTVIMPPAPEPPPDDDPDLLVLSSKAVEILNQHIDVLAPDVVAIRVGESGEVLSLSSDPDDDNTTGPYYASIDEYQPPTKVKTVLRSELIELERLSGCVDQVCYLPSPSREEHVVVFKYYQTAIHIFWQELHILLRLPPHPNILLLDAIVLDEITGAGVVGYTTRFIPNGTLDDNRARPFKLKWLRELMQVVDDLNFKFGMVHQDIAARNLLVDPNTDSILLFDFDSAAKIGTRTSLDHKGENPSRNDVKGTMFFLYEFITHDPSYKEFYLHFGNEADIEHQDKWIKHAEVQLDHDVTQYYNELMAWVRKRRSGDQITHFTQASEYIDWPADLPSPPEDLVEEPDPYAGTRRVQLGGLSFRRSARRRHNRPFLEWQRPPSTKVDHGRRLLATGKYADEIDGVGGHAGRSVVINSSDTTNDNTTTSSSSSEDMKTDKLESLSRSAKRRHSGDVLAVPGRPTKTPATQSPTPSGANPDVATTDVAWKERTIATGENAVGVMLSSTADKRKASSAGRMRHSPTEKSEVLPGDDSQSLEIEPRSGS